MVEKKLSTESKREGVCNWTQQYEKRL